MYLLFVRPRSKHVTAITPNTVAGSTSSKNENHAEQVKAKIVLGTGLFRGCWHTDGRKAYLRPRSRSQWMDQNREEGAVACTPPRENALQQLITSGRLVGKGEGTPENKQRHRQAPAR